MARKYAYHIQNLTTNKNVDRVNHELFGKGVKSEIHKAEQVLKDFASYDEYVELQRDLNNILEELNACTDINEPSKIMRRVRKQYIDTVLFN